MPIQAFQVVLPGTKQGEKLDFPQEFLDKMISPYSRNMEFYLGKLQARSGLSKMSTTVLPGAPVMTKAVLDLTEFGGVRTEIFATKTDILKYDFSNARFDFLNVLYTTGTVEVQVGTPTILRGTGTSWTANVKIGDYIKLGSGSVHTGSTWYRVTAVTSDVLLTVASAMPTTGAGSAYVSRATFTGGATNYFDWVQFEDTALGQLIVMTNGVDKPFYWTGTGQLVMFTAGMLPSGMTAAKYVTVFAGRLLMTWCVVGGQNQPQRCVGWDPYLITSPDEIAFPIDFVEEPTQITGFGTFGGYVIIFKETNARQGRFVGGDAVLAFEVSYQCKGAKSAQSIVFKNDFMAYYGSDKKFHKWNLLQDIIISENIFPETIQFDPNYESYVQGFDVARKNQIRWLCPLGSTTQNNYVAVYDYAMDVMLPWEYSNADACSCFGSYLRTSDVYADDPVYGAQYADETGGYADDSSFLDNGEVVIMGGYDGYVRLVDSGSTDDGTAYTRFLRIKRLNFDYPDNFKRLNMTQHWFDAAISGTVTIKLMKNDSTSYLPGTNTVSLVPAGDEDVVKRNVVWDIWAQDFQLELSSTNFFATLGFLAYFFKKQTTRRGVGVS